MSLGKTEIDVFIIITFVFVILGFALPYIQESFGYNVTANTLYNSQEINFLTISTSIISMFGFTFGALPLWLDLCIFVPLRIFWILVFKKLVLV